MKDKKFSAKSFGQAFLTVVIAYVIIGFFMHQSGSSVGILIPFVILALYFIPTITAYKNKKQNHVAILVLNLFLGWTLIGWIIALVWATAKDSDKAVVIKDHGKAGELEKFADLKAKGVITEAEFEAKKKQLLGL